MDCWKCGKPLTVIKITFRTSCDHCGASQHCCVNCQFHAKGKPNQCLIPNTDLIIDREKFNFCEEFKPIGKLKSKPGPTLDDVSKRLFGDL